MKTVIDLSKLHLIYVFMFCYYNIGFTHFKTMTSYEMCARCERLTLLRLATRSSPVC